VPSSVARGGNFTRLRRAGQKTRTGDVECIQVFLVLENIGCLDRTFVITTHTMSSEYILYVINTQVVVLSVHCNQRPHRYLISTSVIIAHRVVLSVRLQYHPHSSQYICNHHHHHKDFLLVYLQPPPTHLFCQYTCNYHPHSCLASTTVTTTHTLILPVYLQLSPT
jgi:hypothetical protein